MKLGKFFALVVLTAACNDPDNTPLSNSNNTSNNTTNNTSNNTATNACATCTDSEVCFEDVCCTPETVCGAGQCGTVTDGCGATIDCGVCCTADNFAEVCPSRPCEVVTACDENQECVYEPVTCGGSACVCAGATCTDTEIRDCRDPGALVCPADFCDPSPSMVDNKIIYANTCIEPDGAICDFSNLCAQGACSGSTCVEAECGPCNLGFWECAPMTTNATCYGIPLSAADLASTNCNDSSANSTFIYLDHLAGTDAADSGSRAQPYESFDLAVAAAKQRGAKGVIVRSGLTLSSTVVLENGISLYGGFSGAPNWKYDGGTLNVNVTATDANGNVVAVIAHDITERTVLYRVNIHAGDAITQKSSSYGVHALNAAGLVLQEVAVQAGNGAPGNDGLMGSFGAGGGNGGDGGYGGSPGSAGENPSCPDANGAPGGAGGAVGLQAGAPGENTFYVAGGAGGGPDQSGEPGRSYGAMATAGANGAGGTHLYELVTNFYVPTGDGESGMVGADGFGGSGGGGSGSSRLYGWEYAGGGGGGGAAGGCGGAGGTAGLAGGGSFGVFASTSTGLQIIDSNVSSGDAGNGGAGGVGGAGGGVGTFGDGAYNAVAKSGGNGGEAVAGGTGGAGGGGSGGATYAIFCNDTQIVNSGSTLAHGASGDGGVSTGFAGEKGPEGDTLNCE